MQGLISHFAVTADGRERTVQLVCVAHFFSHFYLLLLPPLFPVLTKEFGIGYTELGFALTAFSLISGIAQVPIGFAVDRFGAGPILIAGIFIEGIAIIAIGVWPFYGAFVFLLILAGAANSVYHPADYSILSHVVRKDRMGRAFSFHTASGLVGEAVAPMTILFLTAWFDWRIAISICGLGGVVVGVLLYASADDLSSSDLIAKDNSKIAKRTNFGLLLSAPILMGVAFFACISVMNRGMTSFSVSALHLDNGLTDTAAVVLLSCWLFASPIGVLIGGYLADKVVRHDFLISLLFVALAVIIFLIAATDLGLPGLAVLFSLGGLVAGAVSPSRDMLIRSLTPIGDSGKVFGFVSTGFNLGGIVAPPVFGYLLDHSQPDSIFYVAALASLLCILTVTGTGFLHGRNRRRSA